MKRSCQHIDLWILSQLESLIPNSDLGNHDEGLQLQGEINISNQSPDVCTLAREFSYRNICRIGKVSADGDSDQLVVINSTGLFDVKKALCKSMEDSLRHIVEMVEPEGDIP